MRTLTSITAAVLLLTPAAIADSSCPPDRYEGSLLTWQSSTEAGEEAVVNPWIEQVQIDANGQLILTDTVGQVLFLTPRETTP